MSIRQSGRSMEPRALRNKGAMDNAAFKRQYPIWGGRVSCRAIQDSELRLCRSLALPSFMCINQKDSVSAPLGFGSSTTPSSRWAPRSPVGKSGRNLLTVCWDGGYHSCDRSGCGLRPSCQHDLPLPCISSYRPTERVYRWNSDLLVFSTVL